MSRRPTHRVTRQPAYVLHAQPWRETSALIDVFARDHGRVGMVAKGVRRGYSSLRAVLTQFQPLWLDWSGQSELKTLTAAEWSGGQPLLRGKRLLCGYYVNELVTRLTAREDPHPPLFDHYAMALAALAGGAQVEPVLRRFELVLLEQLGYGLLLEFDSSHGAPLEPDRDYDYLPEQGPQPAGGPGPGNAVRVKGQTLIALHRHDFTGSQTLAESKRLLRALIQHHLGGQLLASRRILQELYSL